jgi:hypothetical protein
MLYRLVQAAPEIGVYQVLFLTRVMPVVFHFDRIEYLFTKF